MRILTQPDQFLQRYTGNRWGIVEQVIPDVEIIPFLVLGAGGNRVLVDENFQMLQVT